MPVCSSNLNVVLHHVCKSTEIETSQTMILQ